MTSIINRRAMLTGGLAAVPAFAAASTVAAQSVATISQEVVDPVFAAIKQHRAARDAANGSAFHEDSPEFQHLMDWEEDLLQALGDMMPTTKEGAAALLDHMVEVEGRFVDENSPLLRAALSVAKALRAI